MLQHVCSCYYFLTITQLAITTDTQLMAIHINSHQVARVTEQRTTAVVYSLVMLFAMACNLLISYDIMQADSDQETKDEEEKGTWQDGRSKFLIQDSNGSIV